MRREKHILEAAEKLFAGGRFHEVTVDEISKRAGVGKGTVYRYFKDKEDLYHKVILSGLDELIAAMEKVGEEEKDPGEGLRHVAQSLADFLSARHALFGLMWSEQLGRGNRKKALWQEWRQKMDRLRAVLAEFIVRGVAEKRYRCPFPPSVTAGMLMGMIRVGMKSHEEMADADGWPVQIVDLFERGIIASNAEA